eukprot:GILI01005990.1.p1 GENE.GILI01005990.1~~GILI01005990.1.p1  ORF type:complete len:234 (-),score=42.76 GILI01005990.1:163-783(-)
MSQRRAELQSELFTLLSASPRNYPRIAAICGEIELESVGSPLEVEVYACSLAAYLLCGDLNNARFLWKRLPVDLRTNAQLRSLHEVLAALWSKNSSQAIGCLQSSLDQSVYSDLISPLARDLICSLRDLVFDLLSSAYSCVSVAQVSSLARLEREAVLAECAKLGWTVDSTSQFVTPKRQEKRGNVVTGLESIEQLSKYVMLLDQK